MVLLGLGLIVGLASLIGGRAPVREGEAPAEPNAPARQEPRPPGQGNRIATLFLACAAFATVAAQFLGAGAEQELVAAAPLEQIPTRLGRWDGTDVPVPDELREMLTPDAALRRVYTDLGFEVHVWVVFWSSRNMVKGYHHPDVCWPNRGFRLDRRAVVPVAAGGRTLPVTAREFARAKSGGAAASHDRQLILYWTQEGRRVWSEDEERRVRAAGDSHDWLGERLFRREPAAPTGRLMVLLGTPLWGDGATIRAQTLELAARLADEVYRVCPWAAPPDAGP
jgi:EpsI family protein